MTLAFIFFGVLAVLKAPSKYNFVYLRIIWLLFIGFPPNIQNLLSPLHPTFDMITKTKILILAYNTMAVIAIFKVNFSLN